MDYLLPLCGVQTQVCHSCDIITKVYTIQKCLLISATHLYLTIWNAVAVKLKKTTTLGAWKGTRGGVITR